jgi:hypothetical protein
MCVYMYFTCVNCGTIGKYEGVQCAQKVPRNDLHCADDEHTEPSLCSKGANVSLKFVLLYPHNSYCTYAVLASAQVERFAVLQTSHMMKCYAPK